MCGMKIFSFIMQLMFTQSVTFLIKLSAMQVYTQKSYKTERLDKVQLSAYVVVHN